MKKFVIIQTFFYLNKLYPNYYPNDKIGKFPLFCF